MRYLLLELICLSVVCVAWTLRGGGGGGRGGRPPGGRGRGGPCPECRCQQYYFNLTIMNELSEPQFTHTITLGIQEYKPLIWHMEQAVEQDPDNFKFTATYFSTLGYFIEAFNGLYGNWADDQTYWQISNDDGPLEVGVSSYFPTPDDNVVFEFVQSTGHDE